VAEAATSAIHRQLEDWRHLPAAEASANVAAVAACLAQHADRCGVAARAQAEELAELILQWPLDHSVDRAAVLADCEKVLRGSDASLFAPPPASTTAAAGDQHREPAPPSARSVVSDRCPETIIDDLPGGNLPFEIVEIPSLPPSLQPPDERPLPDGREPHLLPPTMQELPRTLFVQGDESPLPNAAGIPDRLRAPRLADEPPLEPPVVDREHPAEMPKITADQLSTLPVRAVINYLHADNPGLSSAAREELIDRGFDTYELAAARRLGSPEPADRQKLADALSSLPISPVRWLLWLSHDKDAEVRRSAVSLMATSTDPRLTGRLREMRATERDRRVCALIDRWSRIKR
jgi:hypothetical protein